MVAICSNPLRPARGEVVYAWKRERGREFRVARHWLGPACFPGLNQRVLHDIFGFLAVLQNAVGDGEKYPAMRANDHFKCAPIAVNGRPVLFAFTGIHWVDLKPRRLRSRFRAKFFTYLIVIPSVSEGPRTNRFITQSSQNAPTSIVRSLTVCAVRDDSAES